MLHLVNNEKSFHTHLNGLESVNKAVESSEDQQWGKVPRPHHTPVPLVLAQIGPTVLIGAPEELQDLQARLHLKETL